MLEYFLLHVSSFFLPFTALMVPKLQPSTACSHLALSIKILSHIFQHNRKEHFVGDKTLFSFEHLNRTNKQHLTLCAFSSWTRGFMFDDHFTNTTHWFVSRSTEYVNDEGRWWMGRGQEMKIWYRKEKCGRDKIDFAPSHTWSQIF